MRMLLPFLGQNYGLRSSSTPAADNPNLMLFESEQLRFESGEEALAWLKRMDVAGQALNQLRLMLAWDGDDVHEMDAAELLNRAAVRLKFGHLLAWRMAHGRAAGLDLHMAALGNTTEFVTPSTMREPAARLPVQPTRDAPANEPTYEDTQVAALLEAAKNGVPFCEECAKAAAARA
jgi:hypothetical protein